MSLVFAGIMSHGPGMTARADRADPAVREPFYAALGRLRDRLERSRPDALIVIAAEHFAMNEKALAAVTRTAIEAAFVDRKTKAALLARLNGAVR